MNNLARRVHRPRGSAGRGSPPDPGVRQEGAREEEGNIAFKSAYTRSANPRAFWIFEVYRDEDAFQAHLKAPYGGPLNAALVPLIEEDASVLTFLDPVT